MKEKCNLNMLKTDNQVILWLAEMNSMVFFQIAERKTRIKSIVVFVVYFNPKMSGQFFELPFIVL